MMSGLSKRFTYHPPKDQHPARYDKIRKEALDFARLLNMLCPDSREKLLAIMTLEEAVMWANAAIARESSVHDFTRESTPR